MVGRRVEVEVALGLEDEPLAVSMQEAVAEAERGAGQDGMVEFLDEDGLVVAVDQLGYEAALQRACFVACYLLA